MGVYPASANSAIGNIARAQSVGNLNCLGAEGLIKELAKQDKAVKKRITEECEVDSFLARCRMRMPI
jgi:hypothetical protein